MKTKQKIIYSTSNYSQFIKDASNRTIRSNPRLRDSMRKYGWLDAFPMLVVLREGQKVIKDGQHRNDIAQQLNLPVKYVICDEDGLQASETSVGLSWTLSDYVNSYIERGNEQYRKLLSFKDETGLSIGTCADLLYGKCATAGAAKVVKSGAFKVKNENQARAVVSVIHAAEKVVKWAKSQRFVSAVTHAVIHAEINVGALCDRIRSQPGRLVLQPTTLDFISMIEDIYNFRNKASIPILHKVKNAIRDIKHVKK